MRIGLVGLLIIGLGACAPTLHVQAIEIVKGVPLIDVRINGVPVVCVIDTGEPNLAVSPRFGGRAWVGFGEPQALPIDEMVIAGWLFTGVAVTLPDSRFTGWEERLGVPEVDCIVGMAFLSELRLTVDYAGEQIQLVEGSGRILRPMGVERGERVLEPLYAEWALVGTATISDALEGVFLFDSAERRVVLTERALAALSDRPALDEHGRGVLSAVEVAGSRIEGVPFEIGDEVWRQQVGSLVGLELDGVVGASFLAGHAVTWDLVERRLVLQPYRADLQGQVLAELASEP